MARIVTRYTAKLTNVAIRSMARTDSGDEGSDGGGGGDASPTEMGDDGKKEQH
jgi:hypothetical protein